MESCWERFAATCRREPSRVAFRQGGRSQRFGELHAAAARAVGALHALGVGAGDTCVLSAENGIDLAALPPALWYLGAVPVFVAPSTPDRRLTEILQIAGAKMLVCDPVRTAAEPWPVPCVPPERLVAAAEVPLAAAANPGRGSIVFTSGSTGRPKGVVQSQRSLLTGCDTVAAVMGLAAGDRLLCPVPWSHDYGWGQLLSVLLRGTSMVLPKAGDPASVAEAILRHRPTVLGGTPSFYATHLRGLSPVKDLDLSPVRCAMSTGAAMPAPVLDAMRTAMPCAVVSLNYGLTETYRSASLTPAGELQGAGEVGPPLPGVDIAIVDPEGRPLPLGQEGEIVHGGACVFEGYVNDPEATARARRPMPVTGAPAVFTGDIGWRDGRGHLHIVGRRDRQIKVMDMRVSLDGIEAALRPCPGVADLAAVALPHEAMGTLVKLAVCWTGPPGGAQRALKVFARTALSRAAQPREVHELPALPRTPSGKVDYTQLAERLRGPA